VLSWGQARTGQLPFAIAPRRLTVSGNGRTIALLQR
jgi:hypothetical protein